jgi:hypothetical protein
MGTHATLHELRSGMAALDEIRPGMATSMSSGRNWPESTLEEAG